MPRPSDFPQVILTGSWNARCVKHLGLAGGDRAVRAWGVEPHRAGVCEPSVLEPGGVLGRRVVAPLGLDQHVEAHDRYRRFLADAFEARAPLGQALKGTVTARELTRLAPVLGFDVSSYPRDLDARQWAGVFAFTRMR